MLKNVTPIDPHMYHTHLPLRDPVAPAIAPQEFKDAMATLVFSICVVAAHHKDEQLGRTVTSFMPLSAEPPRIMISIDVRSRLVDLIGLSRAFSISFFSAGQESVADAFAGKSRQDDRFSISDWDYWPSGSPKLSDASVSMDCELVGSLDAGDHLLFIGVITETELRHTLAPLLWSDRDYLVANRRSPQK
ncbi:MAG: flavin reductase [Stutzerimonas stutzeri]|nr:MAG: flavin reductase [Stutzerimonas stutzeri]